MSINRKGKTMTKMKLQTLRKQNPHVDTILTVAEEKRHLPMGMVQWLYDRIIQLPETDDVSSVAEACLYTEQARFMDMAIDHYMEWLSVMPASARNRSFDKLEPIAYRAQAILKQEQQS